MSRKTVHHQTSSEVHHGNRNNTDERKRKKKRPLKKLYPFLSLFLIGAVLLLALFFLSIAILPNYTTIEIYILSGTGVLYLLLLIFIGKKSEK